MTSRRISPDALAIRWSLECSIARMRKAALDTLRAGISGHSGNLSAVARDLGVDRRTLGRWLEDYPELRKACEKARR